MYVLYTCTFEKVAIKLKEQCPVQGQIWAFFLRVLMLVLVKRMFDQISINNKVAVAGTTFPPL